MQEQVFIFRDNYVVVNLMHVFQPHDFSIKMFFVSFVINGKKTTVMKNLSIHFGHHSLAFLNSFLNILNKC